MTLPQPPTDAQLATYIGPSWEKAYRRKFERFRQDPQRGFKPWWNWRAAFSPGWDERGREQHGFTNARLRHARQHCCGSSGPYIRASEVAS